jgi:hypothetical protein
LKKKYDAQFKVVFDAIRQLMAPPDEETEDRISGRREGRFVRTKVKRFILTFRELSKRASSRPVFQFLNGLNVANPSIISEPVLSFIEGTSGRSSPSW